MAAAQRQQGQSDSGALTQQDMQAMQQVQDPPAQEDAEASMPKGEAVSCPASS